MREELADMLSGYQVDAYIDGARPMRGMLLIPGGSRETNRYTLYVHRAQGTFDAWHTGLAAGQLQVPPDWNPDAGGRDPARVLLEHANAVLNRMYALNPADDASVRTTMGLVAEVLTAQGIRPDPGEYDSEFVAESTGFVPSAPHYAVGQRFQAPVPDHPTLARRIRAALRVREESFWTAGRPSASDGSMPLRPPMHPLAPRWDGLSEDRALRLMRAYMQPKTWAAYARGAYARYLDSRTATLGDDADVGEG